MPETITIPLNFLPYAILIASIGMGFVPLDRGVSRPTTETIASRSQKTSSATMVHRVLGVRVVGKLQDANLLASDVVNQDAL